MDTDEALFYFDYVDPASYLVDVVLNRLGLAERVRRIPFEVCPPGAGHVDPHVSPWLDHQADMASKAEALDVPMVQRPQVPWSRKAHELVAFAEEKGLGPEVHRAVFRACFREGLDIGRIDVLVELGVGEGLEFTETRAVLDVDRHASTVEEARARALAAGVSAVPTLAAGGARMAGLHSPDEIETFLEAGKAGSNAGGP